MIKRFIISLILSFAVKRLLHYMKSLLNKFDGDQEMRHNYKEVYEGLIGLINILNTKLKLRIKAKELRPDYKTRKTKKNEKHDLDKLERKKRKMEKYKKWKKRLGQSRWWGMLVMLLIINTLASAAAPVGFGEAEAVEPLDLEWKFCQHLSIDVAWELGMADEHSIAFLSVVTWRDMLNLDLGLVDFEEVQSANEQWYDDINPSVGVSADVINLIEQVPGVSNLTQWIPDVVGIGIGAYMELGTEWDVLPILYIVATW